MKIPAVVVGRLLEDQVQQAREAGLQVIAAKPAHAADADVVLMDHARLTQHPKVAGTGGFCYWQGKVSARDILAAASQLNDNPQPQGVSHGGHQAEQVQFVNVRVGQGSGGSAGHVPILSIIPRRMFTLMRTYANVKIWPTNEVRAINGRTVQVSRPHPRLSNEE